jgi:quercetin 2,3-dioxygenase
METILHKSDTRGHADHGWLNAHHSFSFASYYDASRVHFGLLRVLNDDIVAPGMGFGTHPHDNMEIVTIPLSGSLAHKDSMGTSSVISSGEVQIMSAGTGITHSEFNASKTEEVNLLQVWVFPKEKNIKPRYDQKNYSEEQLKNKFYTIVSPERSADSMWINQDAYFSIGRLDENVSLDYNLKTKGNGVYAFLIDGKVTVAGNDLEKRDGLGITEADQFSVKALQRSFILLVEVPMR